MWSRKKVESAEDKRAAEYVTPEEFCAIFTRDMDQLYTLALLLTGTPSAAEKCFIGALEDCRSAKVFRNWERSWSRLAVIERAIRAVKPLQWRDSRKKEDSHGVEVGLHHDALPVMQLNPFDRFVFVLSVLDRYSVRDCAILLKCGRREIEEARRRAMEHFAEAGRPVLPIPIQTFRTSIQL